MAEAAYIVWDTETRSSVHGPLSTKELAEKFITRMLQNIGPDSNEDGRFAVVKVPV